MANALPSYFRGSASHSFRLILLAEVLWHLGYPDQAQQCSHEALRLAHAAAMPVETAVTLIFAARLHRYRREPQHTLACAEQALALYQAQGPAPRLTPAQSPQVGRFFGTHTAEDPTLRLTHHSSSRTSPLSRIRSRSCCGNIPRTILARRRCSRCRCGRPRGKRYRYPLRSMPHGHIVRPH